MREHAFATVISHNGELRVSHLPLVLLGERGSKGTLMGHLARANDQWRDFDGRPVTCVFHGPHGYISPSWYQEQPAVPTWNYAVVHAQGRPRLIESPEAIGKLIERTIAAFEPGLLDPNAAGHPPVEYRSPMFNQIVGFEMEIESLEGKFKLGQNRSLEDQAGIAEALAKQGHRGAELLSLMSARAARRPRP